MLFQGMPKALNFWQTSQLGLDVEGTLLSMRHRPSRFRIVVREKAVAAFRMVWPMPAIFEICSASTLISVAAQ